MDEKEFAGRLAALRNKKGVSARDMSLSIGQNPGYINNIESGKAMPSMGVFFFICDYLNITPRDFFDTDAGIPETICDLVSDLKKLDDNRLSVVSALVKELVK